MIVCCPAGTLSCPGLTKEVDVALKTQRNKLPTGPVGNESQTGSGHQTEERSFMSSGMIMGLKEAKQGLFSQGTEY